MSRQIISVILLGNYKHKKSCHHLCRIIHGNHTMREKLISDSKLVKKYWKYLSKADRKHLAYIKEASLKHKFKMLFTCII